MKELFMETGESPEIHIDSHDRLAVKAWDQHQVRARSHDDSLALSQEGEQVTVSADSPLNMRVPAGSTLMIHAHHEAAIQGVQGHVRVIHASSSLTLSDLAAVEVDLIGKDLNGRNIGGDLTARQVGRFANLIEIDGNLKIEFIGAHLNLKNAHGAVAAEAGGNANLELDPQPGQEIRVRSKGVLTCRVPSDLNARVQLNSGGPIKVKIGESRQTIQEGVFEATYGEGAGLLALQANGPVSLFETAGEQGSPPFDFDFNLDMDLGNLGEQVGEQIASQMQMIEEQLEAQMAGLSAMMEGWNLSPENAERLQERTSEKIARAQEKIRRAQERASRKIEQAQRRAERKARKSTSRTARQRAFRRTSSVDLGGRRRTQSDPVSDEERMMILNMLAEKKIGLEEAEALLAALEGK
jgi:hypothetical protein